MRKFLLAFLFLQGSAPAQQQVVIQVDAAASSATPAPFWTYFGYDEANYTYTVNGRKLIRELAELSRTPVHIRTHFLLATGDGRPALKWSSTNVYTEDAGGNAVYDWTLVDKVLSTIVDSGAIPFVEIGFMPKALATHPDPYTATWIPGAKNRDYFAGWTYPPKNYDKWSELVYQWVHHSEETFGKNAVEQWDWEVWNEPDIAYWHGTPEEYDKLYDYTAAAVKRALPDARVGGPASTGPANPKAGSFLRQFLEHCSSGRNYVTGEPGAPLDFISFHAKGGPHAAGDHVRMGLAAEMRDVSDGFAIVKSFEKFRKLPIVLSEADPEGCAACSARVYRQNAYRNGTLYPAYEAMAWKTIAELARRDEMNLAGMLTWAFEFEEQPYFDGFRTLATNGIDKPVLNFFRMLGILTGNPVEARSSAAVSAQNILSKGVPKPVVEAAATRAGESLAVLLWHYQDEDVPRSDAEIDLHVHALPPELKRVQVMQFRIDQDHSNAYAAWKRMGSPQQPSAEQYRELVRAGQLQLEASPYWAGVANGQIALHFALPLQALSLVELRWPSK